MSLKQGSIYNPTFFCYTYSNELLYMFCCCDTIKNRHTISLLIFLFCLHFACIINWFWSNKQVWVLSSEFWVLGYGPTKMLSIFIILQCLISLPFHMSLLAYVGGSQFKCIIGYKGLIDRLLLCVNMYREPNMANTRHTI